MTARERMVMLDTARGLTAQQIADHRDLSLFGVQHTLRRVKRALGAETIAHAVALSIVLGYVTPEDVTA